MNPQEEQQDLIKNPLPATTVNFAACPSEQVLQNIAFLTESIEETHAHINYLQRQLDQLKSRAIAENIKESDGFFLVETPGKKMRNPITDIEAFETRFPEGIKLIRTQQATDIFDKFTKDTKNLATSAIPLGIADKKVGEDLVTEFVGYQLQKVSITVMKKSVGQRQIE